MVDEFSNFARMPKPVFRDENVHEIARQALFLHEVAHPAIQFTLDAPEPPPRMVCDRRQIGQALTNIVKNACEAIEAGHGEGQGGRVAMTIREGDGRLLLDLADDGVGLPPGWRLEQQEGLGLSITRQRIEGLHPNGTSRFAVKNRMEGGTEVEVSLPLRLVGDEKSERAYA